MSGNLSRDEAAAYPFTRRLLPLTEQQREADEEAFAELERLLADLFLIAFGDPEQPAQPRFQDVARGVVHAMCEAAPPETVLESLGRLKGLCSAYDID